MRRGAWSPRRRIAGGIRIAAVGLAWLAVRALGPGGAGG
jgi:hypothetical protein